MTKKYRRFHAAAILAVCARRLVRFSLRGRESGDAE